MNKNNIQTGKKTKRNQYIKQNQAIIKSEKLKTPPKLKANKRDRQIKYLFFSMAWAYLVIRIIFTDIDCLILNEFTNYSTSLYIAVRLLAIILFIVAAWIKIGNKKFWKNLGLFVLFPIYPFSWQILRLLLWDFPKYATKHKLNFLLFSYFEFCVEFFFRFKQSIAKLIIFLLAVILMYSFDSQILWLSIIAFGFLQFLHLNKRWNELFGPIKIFQIKLGDLNPNMPYTKEKLKNHFKKISSKRKSKKEKRISEMEHVLLMNEFMKLFDKKIKEILQSNAYMKSFIFKSFYSFIFAMFIFGCINYCLYKINPSNFAVEKLPEYFDFFYYSFFTVIPDGTDIEPVSRIAKLARMLGVGVGIFINIIIFAVYITTNSQKYQENLKLVSIWSDSSSKEISNYFRTKYKKDPTQGLEVLRDLGSEIEKNIKEIRKLF